MRENDQGQNDYGARGAIDIAHKYSNDYGHPAGPHADLKTSPP
jgi:hypothetical protein